MRVFPLLATALLMIQPALAASKAPRKWTFGPHSYLTRAAAEPGAPANSQPMRVDEAALAQALGALQFISKGKPVPLFLPEEAQALARALAEALAQVGPGEDLQLLSTWKRHQFFLSDGLGVTGRVFAQDGRINLIVQETRLDWVYQYNITDNMPTFDYGSRTRGGRTVLAAPAADLRRPDWVVLTLAPVQAAPVQAAPMQAAPMQAAPVQAAPMPQPSVAASPSPAVVPLPDAKPAPLSAATVEERLQTLKRFRDQGLITEEEYARKKQELLKEFSK